MRVRFQTFEQRGDAVGAGGLEDVIERFEPFLILDILDFCGRALICVRAVGSGTVGV